jgi:hypothetical protein
VTEAAVHGEIRHGVAVIDEDIEVWDSAQRRADERGFAAVRPRNAGGRNARSQSDLGERIHADVIVNAFHPVVARVRFCGKCIAATGDCRGKVPVMSWSEIQSKPHAGTEAKHPDANEVMAHLQRIVESRDFPASERNRRFLKHVVENSLEGRRTSARDVAVHVFGRPASFDSLKDPIVRIEAAKLRRDLETYYLKSGKHDPIHISLAKGRYVAQIRYNNAYLPGAEHSQGSVLILRAALLGLAGAHDEAQTAWRAVQGDYPDFSLNPRAHEAVQGICGADRRVRELVLEGLRLASSTSRP